MAELTLGSLFDGLGGWQLAALHNGVRPIWSSEIEAFPIAVTKKHFPDTLQLGDITKLDGTIVPPVDIICAGSPCQGLSISGKGKGLSDERSGLFRKAIDIVRGMRTATNGEYPKFFIWENVCFAKSTLISTQSGFKEIQDVVVGDKVLTKSGQYHEVEQTFITKKQMTLKLQVCGAETITVTPRHPFWVKQKEESKAALASWKCAEELRCGDWIAYRTDGFGEKTIGKPFAYAVGRWLADGSIVQRDSHHNGSRGGQRYRIFISTGYKKFSLLKEELSKLPYRISENKMKHAVNFTFSSDYFAKLIESCGKGALNKRLPEYVFQLPFEEQKELLRGYLDGDGYLRRKNEVSCCTASRHLAYGLARLVRNIYHVGCGISYSPPRKCVVIENRIVKSRGAYNCYFSIPSHRKAKNVSSYFDDGFVWCRVKNIENGELEDVYNLSVSRDNTYCANGVTVHNCGAFSTNQRHDFQAVLEEITETKIPMPVSGQWAEAGMVRSRQCDVSWRVLDAQYWGVPQRRKRIFLIADFRDKQSRNTAVLFEPESVPGDTAPGGNDGQGDAERVKGNIDEASRSVVGADIYNTTNTTGNTTAQNHGGVAVVENKHCEAYAVHENQQACITLKPVANAMQTGGGKPGQGYPCTLQPQKQAYRFDSMAKRLPGVEKMEQYAVDFGRTGDRIQMNATQSKTLLGLAGGGAAKTGWYYLKKEGDNMNYIVRRLTPVECERLQGLPDRFTDVECNGKPASDSQRYKAIGNGMAQPCADFVLSKVVQALRC